MSYRFSEEPRTVNQFQDCAFCNHSKFRHRKSDGICIDCKFYCQRFRNYRAKHNVDPYFRYWFEEWK